MKTKLLLTLITLFLATIIMAQTQIGADIDGEAAFDYSGTSVCMPDANTVAIGASFNSGNAIEAGHVRVYAWNGSAWTQKGMDIDGEASSDLSGSSVSMPDANTVAIGAPYNNGNGTDAGHVRVYSLSPVGFNDDNTTENTIVVHPNPTNGKCTIELENLRESLTVSLRSLTGQKIMTRQFRNTNQIQFEINQPDGMYILEILDDQGKMTALKIIKE